MKKQILAMTIAITFMFLTGCSLESNIGKGFGEAEQTEYMLQENNVCRLNEKIGLIEPTEEDSRHIAATYIVKTAEVYMNPTEAGLTKEKLAGYVDDQRAIMKQEEVTLERIMSSPVLIVDISITNVDQENPMVSNFMLAEKQENQRMEMISPPCYFSDGTHKVNSGVDNYYHYELNKGETKELKLGYYLGADDYQLENVYLSDHGYDDEQCIHYIELGLRGAVQ